MDTPESKTTPANNIKKLIPSSSDSPAFQDSPVFNYISSLSPIQPVKAGPVAQGFPGLASPPLVFTSPRLNSQPSFFNRKLQSSGSNSDFSQDHENFQKYERGLGDSVNVDPEFHITLVRSDQKACYTKKLVLVAHSNPSGVSGRFDEFLGDPGKCANSSHKTQSDNAPATQEGGCLEKIDVGYCKDVGEKGSALQKGKERAQPKSRISVKLVKNEARHLISSSESLGALPRLLTDHTSAMCQTGDSFSEGSHLERGTLRRCLFDESQRKNSVGRSGSFIPAASALIQESANLSYGKLGNRHMIDLFKPTIGACISPATGNDPVVISKSLGMGLHLNSVVYPRSTDSAICSQESSVVRVEGNNLPFITNNQSDGKINDSNMIGEVPNSYEEVDQHQACLVPTADNTIATDANEPFDTAMDTKLDACSTITYDKRKLSSEFTGNNESSVSPKKKRKKASSSTDDDTSKRCNCRKTKCLKLYCDCFAAGFYCGESCACQGCFNRPEYEDTVLETRQQIESRNPLAFAPKVTQTVTGSPTSGKEIRDLSTPASARHKRGCNCKKSMCLKKYCECYQANVGCSEGCRCEGCKNIYGIREDYSIAREIMLKRASIEISEGTMTATSNFVSSRVHSSPDMTPITPALQCSDQRNNAPKSRLPFRRFLQSTDPHHDMLTSEKDLHSPRNSQNNSLLLERNKCIDLSAVDAEVGSENTVERLVPAIDECISGPCSPPSNNDANDSNLNNISQPETFDRTGPLPPSNSLRWRSSPITPITQLVDSELKVLGTRGKYSDMFEDDTPEILKHSSIPVKSVKVSSPNKKRISPPHNHMNSSESLKCSRKFVLRAVPSFPPLTPYAKNSSSDNRGQ